MIESSAKKSRGAAKQEKEQGPVPFDEALKRVWRSPPQHKPAAKPAKKRTTKKPA